MRRWAGLSAILLWGCAGPARNMDAPAAVPATVELKTPEGASVGTLHLEPGKPPALWPLKTIGGVNVTRAFPFRDDHPGEAHDHPHHRSCWIAHGDVNGVDFWHDGGRIEHRRLEVSESGAIRVEGDWCTPEGEVLLHSSLEVWARDHFGTTGREVCMMLDLTPANGPVVFGDTKEGTCAIRLAPQLRLEGQVASGSLENSNGVQGKAVWGKRSDAIIVSGVVDGSEITLELTNFGPESASTRWHARPYGLIAANPFGDRAFDRSLPARETLLKPDTVIRLMWCIGLRESKVER
ncbi:MAG: PmoA family protein [Phycisphaerales bacterium]|nr:PmoA family protein [Phycisphaerales bacterium]